MVSGGLGAKSPTYTKQIPKHTIPEIPYVLKDSYFLDYEKWPSNHASTGPGSFGTQLGLWTLVSMLVSRTAQMDG